MGLNAGTDSEVKKSKKRKTIGFDEKSLKANRLPLERRKCLCRSTVARCPEPNDLRVAWNFRNDSEKTKLRLGGLLQDLECYVNNDLIVIYIRKKRKIVRRNPGIKGWIKENCPELLRFYTTLMRFKSKAMRFRQYAGLQDPIPLSVILNPEIAPEALVRAPIAIQPRDLDLGKAHKRFAWEGEYPRTDADGRLFLPDANYSSIKDCEKYVRYFSDKIEKIRAKILGEHFNDLINALSFDDRVYLDDASSGSLPGELLNPADGDSCSDLHDPRLEPTDGATCSDLHDQQLEPRDSETYCNCDNEKPRIEDVVKDVTEMVKDELKGVVEGFKDAILGEKDMGGNRKGVVRTAGELVLKALDAYMDLCDYLRVHPLPSYGKHHTS